MPQSLSEFNLWLTDRKAIWSRHRKEGKTDAQGRFPATGQLSSSSGGVGKKKPMGVMDLVRNAALAGIIVYGTFAGRSGEWHAMLREHTTQVTRSNSGLVS